MYSFIMSIDICKKCKCPQIGIGLQDEEQLHFKNCKEYEEGWFNARRKKSLKKLINDQIKYRKQDVKDIKKEIREFADCLTKTCLDEVYECRWDCCIMPEEVRLLKLLIFLTKNKERQIC